MTQTAWIGPRDCLIDEVLFKTLPLVSYPELQQLADKVSNLLATKAGLSVIYNSIVVNVCRRAGDVYRWRPEDLDEVVFEAGKPLSIITVGVSRKLVIQDRAGGNVGVVIMGSGSLLHLKEGFLERYRIRADCESDGVTVFLTLNRCKTETTL